MSIPTTPTESVFDRQARMASQQTILTRYLDGDKLNKIAKDLKKEEYLAAMDYKYFYIKWGESDLPREERIQYMMSLLLTK